MTFKQAVEDSPDLEGAWRAGLQALRRTDRKHLDVQDTKRLTGSVDLDRGLKQNPQHANDPVWDYGIGHRPTNRNDEIAYWVEVHPANDAAIKEVLAKLAWLKKWLRERTQQSLHSMRREFIWVSSGKTSFTLNSPQQKQLAQKGLRHKGRLFKIPDQCAEF